MEAPDSFGLPSMRQRANVEECSLEGIGLPMLEVLLKFDVEEKNQIETSGFGYGMSSAVGCSGRQFSLKHVRMEELEEV